MKGFSILILYLFSPLIMAESDIFNKDERLKKLSPLQYMVTQKSATESAFRNAYWNNTAEGIYVDVVSGEVLFSSRDKHKSGTGWPSFSKTVNESNIVLKEDTHLLFFNRTEVRSKSANSHLGHLFKDKTNQTGLRYCINSAALIFIPKSEMIVKGYGDYLDKL